MAQGLQAVLTAQNTDSVSIRMYLAFLFIQVTFAEVGLRDRSWALFVGMVLSAIFTGSLIVYVVYVRNIVPL